MLQLLTIRKACPSGTCLCVREQLLHDIKGDMRILTLTQTEEKKLIIRLENISSYLDLQHMIEHMHTQLGIVLQILPGEHEVRTPRGLQITLLEQPGLCKKTRQTIPGAIRKCLDNNPDITYAILNAHDLLSNS